MLSLNWNVETPICTPSITAERRRFSRVSRSKKGISQPRGVSVSNVERLTKYPSLVAAARMRRVEAVVFELSNIEVRFVLLSRRPDRRRLAVRARRRMVVVPGLAG